MAALARRATAGAGLARARRAARCWKPPAFRSRSCPPHRRARDRAERGRQDAGEVAALLAREKARAVAAQVPDRLVLGADQTLALGERRFSKPADRARRASSLRRCAARPMSCIRRSRSCATARYCSSMSTAARLTMRAFSDEFPRRLSRCGRRRGDRQRRRLSARRARHPAVRADRGRHFTILGLPLLPLLDFLRRQRLSGGVSIACSSSASPARSAWANRPRRGSSPRRACRCMIPTRWCTGSTRARRSPRSRRRFPGTDRGRQGRSRASSAQRVLGDPAALQRLEAIVHPLVRAGRATHFLPEARGARRAGRRARHPAAVRDRRREARATRWWWSRRRPRCSARACWSGRA